ncbi:MAG: carbohydrate binding family 9 domain-containing protein [Lewinellaceae bacterium]|nr:carbohydrate binding family 9 domain-containing protein [Lewinellaceae bacterium]
MMRTYYLLLPIFVITFGTVNAQGGAAAPATAASEYQLHIRKSADEIQINGILDEPCWQTADVLSQFHYQFPVDTGLSAFQTEIRMTFNDRFLYIAAICHQPKETITFQSLKRDFANGTSDVLNILFDPFKDGLNGVSFGVNPLNVQREALIDNGTTLSFDWDNRWNSAVSLSDDHWTVEIAIPFKTLRYKVTEGQNSWYMNFVRLKLRDPEVSTWYPVPRQYAANNVAFTGKLIWDDAPPSPGANVSFIPYASGRYDIEYNRDPTTLDLQKRNGTSSYGIGGDAKVAVTPSLNLDLTFNPDFSQVEVDRQVTNLSRFELFFPERRQFFLENRDLFAMFGFPSTRPFFSRRIGLAYNPNTGQNEAVPILAGARLSGKINENWRIGLLNMQTQRKDWDSLSVLPAANFTVATLQRKVRERSAISAIFVDKENALGKLNEAQRAISNPGKGWQGWSLTSIQRTTNGKGNGTTTAPFPPTRKSVAPLLPSFWATATGTLTQGWAICSLIVFIQQTWVLCREMPCNNFSLVLAGPFTPTRRCSIPGRLVSMATIPSVFRPKKPIVK